MNNTNLNKNTDAEGSVRSYTIGFFASIILTIIAFGIVKYGDFNNATIITVVMACAVLQVLVQLIYFMHMGSASEWWNRTSLVFTVLTIAILVGGSLWVMWYLHHNMMPEGHSAHSAIDTLIGLYKNIV